MALFKIFGNFASGNTTLPSTATQGYCYFDKNTGKFYIDTTNTTAGRMALNANKADRLSNTSKIGDTNKPVYFTANGTPTAISYTIAKSVPSTAVFTDTWEPMTGATSSTSGTVGYINSVPPKTGYNTKFWRADGTWAEPTGTYTYTLPTASSSTKGGIKVNGNGLKIESDVLKHSNSITAKTSYGSTSTAVNANGGTLTVTDVKYDANGHITGSTDRTITFSQAVADNDKVYQDETTTSNWRKLLLSYHDSGTDYASVTTSTSKVFQTQKIEAQPSSGTIRAVGFQANGSGSNASYELYNNNIRIGYWKSTQSGTTSDIGYSHLYIGNNIAQGSDGNARGVISLYSKDSARHMVYSTLSGSDDQYVYLQDYAGPQYLIHGGTSSKIGDTNQPVYIAADGRATAISHTIAKSVPSTAVFTDTWNPMTGATSSTSGTVGYINAVPPKTGYNTKFWRADGTWAEPAGTYTYTLPTASSSTLGGIKVNGNGLKVENDILKHSNSITAKTTYGSTATAVNANGGTFCVTDVKYDANGHITGSTDRVITISQEDKKVLQGSSEAGAWRKVLLGSTSSSDAYADVTTATDQVYQSKGVEVYPYTGVLRAIGLRAAGTGTSAAIRLYSNEVEVGSWTPTATGTTSTTGYSHLYLGNNIATGTNGNSRGSLSIYGREAARSVLMSSLTGTADNDQYVYLQNYAGTQYLIHAGTTAAVGSSDQPVYVAANGRITAVDSSYVKTTGDTMTGTLTLSSGNVRLNTGNFCLEMEGYSRGTTATTAVEKSFAFYDNNYNKIVGRVRCQVNTSGRNRTTLEACKNNTSMSTAYLYVDYDSTTSSAGCSTEFTATKVWGAVYNDYAEFRETENVIEAGRCVYEQGDGKLALANERLMRGCELVSDTYGFAIGKNEKAKTPIAVTGRVLAYCLEGQEEAKKFIGYPVCSGPNGTVSIMTEEEEAKYPSRIIGTISEVPTYDKWKCGTEENPEYIDVNNRIWIRIR